jgi:hypothetical protein
MLNLRRISLPIAVALSMLGTASAHAAVSADQPCSTGTVTSKLRFAPQSGVRACSPDDLAGVLKSEYKGRIVIPRDVFWTMKGTDVTSP